MRRRGRPGVGLVMAAVFTLIQTNAVAQSTLEVNGGLELGFVPPGARSLAMGGASLALEGDAAAAVNNPAGLATLEEPEVTLEVRGQEIDSRFASAGGVRFAQGSRDESGLIRGSSLFTEDGVSLAGFVWPGDTWAISAFWHERAHHRSQMRSFGPGVMNDGMTIADTQSAQGKYELDLEDAGVVVAWEIVEGFMIGGGATWSQLDLEASTRRYTESQPFPSDIFSPAREAEVSTLEGDDDDVVLHAGMRWRIGIFSLGAAYRQGPEHEVVARRRAGQGTANPGAPLGDDRATLKVPDVWGLGVALEPSDGLTFTVEWNRIEYSDLSRDVVDPNGLDPALVQALEVRDSDALRGGVEWALSGDPRWGLSIRAGAWRDEGHRTTFTGDPARLDPASAYLAAAFIGDRDDEIHYTIGFGFGFGDHFALDTAGDFSDLGDSVGISGTYRF